MSTPRLQWSDNEGRQKVFWLSTDEILLGRHSSCDVILADPYVSRKHASVRHVDGTYEIADLGSTHGTFVNGQSITRHALRSGEQIVLGRGHTTLTFLSSDSAEDQHETTWDSSVENSILELASALPEYAGYSDLEKLSLLLDFQYALGRNFSAQKTFEQILQSALKVSGAERGFILLREEDDFRYVVGMEASGQSLQQSEFVQASQTVVHQVASSGNPLYETDGISGDLAQQESIVIQNLRALSCMPLRWLGRDADHREVRGILYLDSTQNMHALSGLDQKILNKLVDEAAAVFEKVEMIEAFEERKRIEHELALAQETQQHLLPAALPENPHYKVCAFSHPTHHVGGDFFDFYDYQRGDLTGVLADVSGKGVSAALLSALTQGALSAELQPGIDPSESIDRANQLLCRRSASNRFVTLFFFQLNSQGEGLFINAGHNPAFVFRAGQREVNPLNPESMIVGAFASATFKSMPLQLHRGDVLVVYSDGLTEAENPTGEMFGEENLKKLILEYGSLGAHDLEARIKAAVGEFTQNQPQTDDITLMLVERA